MKTAVEAVNKFMEAAGQATPGVPRMTGTALEYMGNPDDMNLGPAGPVLGGQVGDWIDELAESWMRQNDAEILENAMRVIWSLLCALRAMGFPLEAAWEEIVRARMEIIDVDGKVHFDEKGQPVKPVGWLPPNLRKVIDDYGIKQLAAGATFGTPTVRHADEVKP